jgi:hypothetical protein
MQISYGKRSHNKQHDYISKDQRRSNYCMFALKNGNVLNFGAA